MAIDDIISKALIKKRIRWYTTLRWDRKMKQATDREDERDIIAETVGTITNSGLEK